MPKVKWNFDNISEIAKKFSTRKEFFDGDQNAYCSAKRLEIFEEVCAHMPKDIRIGRARELNPAFKWTEEKIREEASKYDTKTAFNGNSRGAYAAAKELGILDLVCAHMPSTRRYFSKVDSRRPYNATLVYNDIKQKALKRGKHWDLTKDQTISLIKQPCDYCNFIPEWPYSRVGIDRVDNSLGYIPDNCVPCCFHCNSAKSEMDLDEFIKYIERLYITTYFLKRA